MDAANNRKTIVVMNEDHAEYVSELQRRFPEARFVGATGPAAAVPLMADAHGLFALAPWVTDEMVAAAPHLEWIQALTTGTDTFATLTSLRPEVLITSTRGVHGPQVAELAILQMMAMSRSLPRMIDNQRNQVWDRFSQPLLWSRNVTIVGLGTIATDLAARCEAFGMVVRGASRTVRDVPHVVQVFSYDTLPEAVAGADFVVVLCPLSDATRHLINAKVLAAMRPGAYLVNVARGGVVDEAALLDALDAGQLAGAGLDVFEQEPLPADSPLWSHPKVLLTPHIGGMSDIYHLQVMPILVSNMRAFANGRPDEMINRVNF